VPTATPTFVDIDALVRAGEAAPPTCECSHSDDLDDPDGKCGDRAVARVTVVCASDECDCAAAVYLLCKHCLSAWKDNARRDGVRLRVTSL
jgi:hypothetical protein